MGKFERAVWLAIVLILVVSLIGVGLLSKSANDKVDDLDRDIHYWGNEVDTNIYNALTDIDDMKTRISNLEQRQRDIRQQVADIEHVVVND